MRHIKFTLLTLAILLMMLPTVAQDSQDSTEWSAYLFDSVNNELVQVDDSGETQIVSLGLSPAGEDYVHGINLNEAGTQAAYCYMVSDSPTDEVQDFFFVVRDIEAQSNRIETELGQPVACDVSAFENGLIALSIVYTYPYGEPLPEGEPTWELRIIDANSGDTLHSVNSESDFMPDMANDMSSPVSTEIFPILARVSELTAESVKFMAILQNASHGLPEYPAYEWTFADNSMTELPDAFGKMNNDYLPETGEVVFRNLNESIEAATPFGPMPLANEVNIMDADGTHTIYTDTDWVIVDTTFINNGKSVLVYLTEGYGDEPDALEQPVNKYLLINRDGTTIEMATEFDGYANTKSIPGGAVFAYTPNPTMESPDWKATQLLVLSSNGTLNLIGEFLPEYEERYSAPRLIWSTPAVIESDLTPFAG